MSTPLMNRAASWTPRGSRLSICRGETSTLVSFPDDRRGGGGAVCFWNSPTEHSHGQSAKQSTEQAKAAQFTPRIQRCTTWTPLWHSVEQTGPTETHTDGPQGPKRTAHVDGLREQEGQMGNEVRDTELINQPHATQEPLRVTRSISLAGKKKAPASGTTCSYKTVFCRGGCLWSAEYEECPEKQNSVSSNGSRTI